MEDFYITEYRLSPFGDESNNVCLFPLCDWIKKVPYFYANTVQCTVLLKCAFAYLFRRNTDNSNSRPLSRLYHRRIPQTWEPCVWYNTRGRQYFNCGHREENIHHPWVCRRTRWTERISSRPAQCRHRWQGLSSAGYSSPCGKRESWIGRCWWELDQKIVVF